MRWNTRKTWGVILTVFGMLSAMCSKEGTINNPEYESSSESDLYEDSDGNRDDNSQSDVEADISLDSDVDSDSDRDGEPDSEADSDMDGDSDVDSMGTPESESSRDVENDAESRDVSDQDSQQDTQGGTDDDADTESENGTYQDTDTKPDTDSDIEMETGNSTDDDNNEEQDSDENEKTDTHKGTDIDDSEDPEATNDSADDTDTEITTENSEVCAPPFSGSSGQNPLFTDQYTADPAPLVHNCTFYVVCGHDEGSTGFVMREWFILKSTDMVNWTKKVGMDLSVFSWAVANAWASHMVEKDGEFYWYVPVAEGHNGAMAIGVAVSDSPEGPFTDAIGGPRDRDVKRGILHTRSNSLLHRSGGFI